MAQSQVGRIRSRTDMQTTYCRDRVDNESSRMSRMSTPSSISAGCAATADASGSIAPYVLAMTV